MAKLADIAKELNLSISIVSRALSDKPDKYAVIKKETAERIRAYAKKIGYQPNRQASFMAKGGKSATIFCFLPDVPTRLTNDLMFGITEEACSKNFPINFFLGHITRDFDKFLRHSQSNSHSGLLTLPPGNMSDEAYKSFCEYYRNDGKIIFLNTLSNTPDTGNRGDFHDVPTLNVDEYYGGQLAAEHLLSCDCDAYYLVNLGQDYIYRTREAGFLSVFESAGVPVKKVSAEKFESLKLHKKNRYGFFVDCDYAALDLYPVFAKKDLIPGKDIFLCGFDDIFYSRISHPSLTTIHQPTRQEGRLAVQLLVSMIYGKRIESEMIRPYLLHRETTGGTRPDPASPELETKIELLSNNNKPRR